MPLDQLPPDDREDGPLLLGKEDVPTVRQGSGPENVPPGNVITQGPEPRDIRAKESSICRRCASMTRRLRRRSASSRAAA